MLEARNIGLFRENGWIFKDLSFALQGGECLSLYGPNGSGKTSLLKSIAGLMTFETGTILWNQKAIQQDHISYFGHQLPIDFDLTAIEMLKFWHKSAREQVETNKLKERLNQIKIGTDINIRHLSQGQKKRLYLSFFVHAVHRPIWLLDEIYSNLDVEASELFGKYLDFHLLKGGIALFATHDPLPFFEKNIVKFNKN